MDWKQFFDSLGMDGTQWQWRIIRWEKRWKDWVGTFKSQKTQVTYKHIICSQCGALMDRDSKVCPGCGVTAPSWSSQVMKRVVGLAIPSVAPVFIALLGVNILLAALGFLQPMGEMVIQAGSLVPPLVWAGEWWRVITYGYLHHGLLHIAMNMFVLSRLGPMLEEEVGSARFFSVYTLTLAGGAVADLIMKRHIPVHVAGSSGALFGLIGFGLSYAHFMGGSVGQMLKTVFLRWVFIGFVIGILVPNIDNTAHFGGFVVGLVLGFIIERERTRKDQWTRIWKMVAQACIIATLLAFGWMLMTKVGVG